MIGQLLQIAYYRNKMPLILQVREVGGNGVGHPGVCVGELEADRGAFHMKR